MIVRCPKCQVRFKIDDLLIKKNGSKLRCSKCKHIFKHYPIKKTSIPKQFPDIDGLIQTFQKALTQVLESAQYLEKCWEEDQFSEKEISPEHASITSDLSTINPQSPAYNQNQLARLLIELSRFLEQNDLQAEDHLELIKPYLSGSELLELFENMENYINKLDFNQAKGVLNHIAQALNIPLTGD